jgi:hypothetical protein
MNEEITTGSLARLFDVMAKTIAELAKRNIITKSTPLINTAAFFLGSGMGTTKIGAYASYGMTTDGK